MKNYYIVFYSSRNNKTKEVSVGECMIETENTAFLNRNKTIEICSNNNSEVSIVITGIKQLSDEQYKEWMADGKI